MCVFDIEADDLLPGITKIHVVSYSDSKGNVHSIHDYDEMRKFFTSAKLLIGHKIVEYDIPAVEKILNIQVTARLIDTLPLSWYLNHRRIIHGLDSYGEEFGIPKPKISDWKNLTQEEYTRRCEEDVKINIELWKSLRKKLMRLYDDDKKEADRLITYLTFKMDCLREQERSKWLFDKDYCEKSLSIITPQYEEKVEELRKYMPKVKKFAKKTRPAKPFTKSGDLSVVGARWFKLLKDMGLPKDFDGEVKVQVGEEEPNPGASGQVKEWLFSMGWVPRNFDYKPVPGQRKKRAIPQVRIDGDEGKELCPSVLELAEKHPEILILEGVTVLAHRISTFKGFLKNQVDGHLIAGASGLTNTLRFKHRELVNLPGVDKAWGEEIRGCLSSPEGMVLCGSDMSSLEDNTKRHYMYQYDPVYVDEMSDPNFDSHLDLATFAGVVTKQEVLDYVCKKVGAKNLKPIRKNFKAANYACIYGVGSETLGRNLEISIAEAQKLIDAYWARNWAVRKVSENVKTKKIGNEMWLKNPVSGFWYSLRAEKDIFSTLNQGTGVYCFDLWVMKFRAKRPQLTGQFHDEVILCIKKGAEEKCRKLLTDAIQEVNDELKLNVTLSVDIQFGDRYSDIH